MARRTDLQLSREQIVRTGLKLFSTGGAAAVSMRKIAAELGASPMSLYVHVGNKNALLDELVQELTSTIEIDCDPETPWVTQAEKWVGGLRAKLLKMPSAIELLRGRPWALDRAVFPLFQTLTAAGFERSEIVRTLRLLVWATVGFVAVETTTARLDNEIENPKAFATRREGVSQAEIDSLFEYQMRLIISGIAAKRA